MKTLIIYASRRGSGRQYARWLAEELGASCLPLEDFSPEKAEGFGQIIFGGSIYAGKIRGASQMGPLLAGWKDKKILIFTVGLAPLGPEKAASLAQANGLGGYPVFAFQGGLDYPGLPWYEKLAMHLIYQANKKNWSPIAERYYTGFSLASKESLKPLAEAALRP